MPTTNTQALALIQKCQEEQDDFLDLGNLGLSTIPEEVFALKHLKQLNLGTHYFVAGEWKQSGNTGNSNFIQQLDERLAELTQLEELFLGKNPITAGNWKGVLQHLKVLDLSYTRLEHYEPIFELKQLEVLKLNGNRLNDLSFLPSSPFHPLKALDLCHNNLRNLKALEVFPNLKVLNASINFLQNTQDFPILLALEELYLGGNFLTQVEELDQLTALEEISLGFLGMDEKVFFRNRGRHNSNFLLKWPNWQRPNKLKTIDFQRNFLSEIPNLAQYTSLEVLCLGQNGLNDLGGMIFARGLKVLTLGNQNPAQHIVKSHSYYLLPETLQNSFVKLDGLENITGLEKLFLGGLGLKEIPTCFTFGQLQALDLSSNQIAEIKNLDQYSITISLSFPKPNRRNKKPRPTGSTPIS